MKYILLYFPLLCSTFLSNTAVSTWMEMEMTFFMLLSPIPQRVLLTRSNSRCKTRRTKVAWRLWAAGTFIWSLLCVLVISCPYPFSYQIHRLHMSVKVIDLCIVSLNWATPPYMELYPCYCLQMSYMSKWQRPSLSLTIEFVGNKGKSDLLCYEDSK